MEEARALLDSAERGKRQTEAELGEARVAVNEMNAINSKASSEKRHVEGIDDLDIFLSPPPHILNFL